MQEFLFGCFISVSLLSILALLSYILLYKKLCSDFIGFFLIIIIVSVIICNMLSLILARWLNINFNFLTLLGIITGFLICPFVGLSNKNLRKLNRAEESLTWWKLNKRQQYRMQLATHTSSQVRSYWFKRNIIECILLISLFITFWFIIYLVFYWFAPKQQQMRFDDKLIVAFNKTLPKELTADLIYESVVVEGLTVVATFTMKNITAQALTDQKKQQVEAEVLSQICGCGIKSMKAYGYRYRYRYITADKQDMISVVADETSCKKVNFPEHNCQAFEP